MAIDPRLEANRERVGEKNGVAVWRPVNPPEKHGIYGMHVAVDSGVCLADGVCLEDCPVNVFTWVDTPGHPELDIKAEPTHEDQCIDYMFCIDVCSAGAIDIDPGRAGRI